MRLVRLKHQGPPGILQVTIVFILYFIRILLQKMVPKFPETVKFQPKCTEFRLRLGLRRGSGSAPDPVVGGGAHIAPHPLRY